MSLATWKAEFYPTPASECLKEQALDHSIRKWEGLTPENLERHKIAHRMGMVGGEKLGLRIDANSCALCHIHLPDGELRHPCASCPIFKSEKRNCDPEWRAFVNRNMPQPMLDLLKRVKESVDSKQ